MSNTAPTPLANQAPPQMPAAGLQSTDLFQAFMGHLPGMAWIKDLDGRYVFVNDLLLRYSRQPASKWLGRTDPEIWPKEIAEQFVGVGSSRVDLQACKLEYSIVSPK